MNLEEIHNIGSNQPTKAKQSMKDLHPHVELFLKKLNDAEIDDAVDPRTANRSDCDNHYPHCSAFEGNEPDRGS